MKNGIVGKTFTFVTSEWDMMTCPDGVSLCPVPHFHVWKASQGSYWSVQYGSGSSHKVDYSIPTFHSCLTVNVPVYSTSFYKDN